MGALASGESEMAGAQAAARARQVQERQSEQSWSMQSVGLCWLEAAARLSADNVKWQDGVEGGGGSLE